MEFIPAIDLFNGSSVRLLRGDYSQTTYYEEPSSSIAKFVDSGVRWVHIVDLNAARGESDNNRVLIAQLIKDSKISVEVGGGVRQISDVGQLVDLGVTRVIVGTKAISKESAFQEMCKEFPGVIAAGLDYRRISDKRFCAVNGWTQDSNIELIDAVESVCEIGASAIIVTDISRDGTLEGPDIETLSELAQWCRSNQIDLISSGGVASIDDLIAIGESAALVGSIFGAISGKAVHEGLIDVSKAVAVCKAFA